MDGTGTTPHPRRAVGILGGLVAAVLLAGSAAAQGSPSPLPTAATAPVLPGEGRLVVRCRALDGRMGGPQRHPGRPGFEAPGPGRQGFGERGSERQGLRERGSGRQGLGEQGFGRIPRLRPPDLQRRVGLAATLGRSATVTSIVGNVVGLATPDGWARAVDTTSIPVTRGGARITTADMREGDAVRVREERAEDGTWSVTAIEVLLDAARGTVATVGTDGFDLTVPDGSTVAVRVSDATNWVTACRETGSLESLQAGAVVAVRGIRADDGSIDATQVVTFGMNMRRLDRGGGRAHEAPVPAPSVSPAASPASA